MDLETSEPVYRAISHASLSSLRKNLSATYWSQMQLKRQRSKNWEPNWRAPPDECRRTEAPHAAPLFSLLAALVAKWFSWKLIQYLEGK